MTTIYLIQVKALQNNRFADEPFRFDEQNYKQLQNFSKEDCSEHSFRSGDFKPVINLHPIAKEKKKLGYKIPEKLVELQEIKHV